MKETSENKSSDEVLTKEEEYIEKINAILEGIKGGNSLYVLDLIYRTAVNIAKEGMSKNELQEKDY